MATQPSYTLIYWPGIPGRGEYIRLALEATSTPYIDHAHDPLTAVSAVQSLISPSSPSTPGNPPAFAPPALRIAAAGNSSQDLTISQTPNILLYLGEKLGFAGEVCDQKWHIHSLALTALDVSNETHDTHHPVAVSLYYEDQKPEALKKATNFRKERIPKFFGYFERVLKGNEELGKGKYLVGSKLSYADTTLWQVLDGLTFAFPKELEVRKEEFPILLGTFYESVKSEEKIKAYLESPRRQKYSQGLFRYYPELDRE